MPFKHNAAHRHRMPRARYRVTNWPAYEAGLRRRGNLTLWLDQDALAGWVAPRRTTPGGQRRYSDLAVELVLTLRLVFHLALRQAEAFTRSVLALLGVEQRVPDHTTLSRRGRTFAGRQPCVRVNDGPVHLVLDSTGLELFGQGEWCAAKHGRLRRRWMKLHLGVDATTGEVAAHVLTDGRTDDAAQVPDLLRQQERDIISLTADGAYDGDPVYQAAAARQPGRPLDVVIPPRSSALLSTADPNEQSPRDHHVQLRAQHGRMEWQRMTGYGKRNVAETTMARYKRLIGPRLRARSTLAQAGEVALAAQVLNRMIREAKPAKAGAVVERLGQAYVGEVVPEREPDSTEQRQRRPASAHPWPRPKYPRASGRFPPTPPEPPPLPATTPRGASRHPWPAAPARSAAVPRSPPTRSGQHGSRSRRVGSSLPRTGPIIRRPVRDLIANPRYAVTAGSVMLEGIFAP